MYWQKPLKNVGLLVKITLYISYASLVVILKFLSFLQLIEILR